MDERNTGLISAAALKSHITFSHIDFQLNPPYIGKMQDAGWLVLKVFVED
jgi:hypothetical protein